MCPPDRLLFCLHPFETPKIFLPMSLALSSCGILTVGNDETRNGTQEGNKEWNEKFLFTAQRALALSSHSLVLL